MESFVYWSGGQPEDEADEIKLEQEEGEEEGEEKTDNDPDWLYDGGKRVSMYFELFESMIITVLEHEYALFSSDEIEVFDQFAKMSYNARYLLARLSLRKPDKWFRLDVLKYETELGPGILPAVKELCGVPQNPKTEEFNEKKENRIYVKQGEDEVIDLTENETKPGPSGHEPQVKQDDDSLVLAEDESHMNLRELLECLKLDELKSIAKQTKLKAAANRSSIISALIVSASNQTTLSFAPTSSKRKAKGNADSKPLRQTCLPFTSTKSKTQEARLREMVVKILGACVKINSSVFKLFRRVNLVYFRSTQYSPTILTPSILERAKKRAYASYIFNRTPNIWPSRKALIEYEEALELEARVDEILGGGSSDSRYGRSVARKTPAQSTSKAQFRTPSAPTPVSVDAVTPKSEVKMQDVEKENGNIGEDCGMIEPKPEENARIRDAKLVVEIFEEVYPMWLALVKTKREAEYSRQQQCLERFECGHILTRIVCKSTHALSQLKEYEYELHVLDSLLSQKCWRRGRRGRWHDRRALVLMNHLGKDEKILRKAMNAIIEALEDDDTHIIYRPMLERRLTRLEKRLKVPPDERHLSEVELRKSEDVYLEGVRIKNRAASLVLDNAGRAVNKPTTNLIGKSDMKIYDMLAPAVVKTGGLLPPPPPKAEPEKWTGKSIWCGKDGEEVNVETYALQHYESQGYKGFHCEGRIVSTIFGLLFWDILFAPIPGAFETKYQAAPLDITEDSFYHSRKDLIEQRLDEITAGKAPAILECVDAAHREKKTCCVGVRWELFEKQDLIEITECLGGKSLSVICRLFCEDYASRTSGVPDLCIWDISESICKFVEVKGPGDRAQENQKIWIDVLLRAGISVEICHVHEPGQLKQKAEKKPKKPKARAKPKPKSKKKAVEVSSDVEDVPLESEDEPEEDELLPSDMETNDKHKRQSRKRSLPPEIEEELSQLPRSSRSSPMADRAEMSLQRTPKKRRI